MVLLLTVAPLGVGVATSTAASAAPSGARAQAAAVPAPALTLVKSAQPAPGTPVTAGQEIAYTLTYANTGDGDAINAEIVDVTPAGTTYETDSGNCSGACLGSYDATDRTLRVRLTVRAGKTGSVSFRVRVGSGAGVGSGIRNSATITTGERTTTSNAVVHPLLVPVAGLTLTKSAAVNGGAGAATAGPGDTLTYTLVAGATGKGQTGVRVSDVVPKTVFRAASCGTGCAAAYDPATRTVSWAVGALAAGSSVTVRFTATVVPAPGGGTVDNTGMVASDQAGLVRSNTVRTPVLAVLAERVSRPATPVVAAGSPTLPLTGPGAPVARLVVAAVVLLGLGVVSLVCGQRLERSGRARRRHDSRTTSSRYDGFRHADEARQHAGPPGADGGQVDIGTPIGTAMLGRRFGFLVGSELGPAGSDSGSRPVGRGPGVRVGSPSPVDAGRDLGVTPGPWQGTDVAH